MIVNQYLHVENQQLKRNKKIVKKKIKRSFIIFKSVIIYIVLLFEDVYQHNERKICVDGQDT
jgi:hypothetical protein